MYYSIRLARANYSNGWRLALANLFGGMFMMPLALANAGEENTIKKIGGSPEVKKHLENLGFVVGGNVTVITSLNGNLIVNVKETRVALNDEMARRIMI